MILERRIDMLQIQLNTEKNMLSKYKNPEKLKKSIEYDEEILGYLLELKERRDNENRIQRSFK